MVGFFSAFPLIRSLVQSYQSIVLWLGPSLLFYLSEVWYKVINVSYYVWVFLCFSTYQKSGTKLSKYRIMVGFFSAFPLIRSLVQSYQSIVLWLGLSQLFHLSEVWYRVRGSLGYFSARKSLGLYVIQFQCWEDFLVISVISIPS